MNMHMFAGKMERELFNYMKFDGGTMPFNEDAEFEACLVENYVYIIPQVCTYIIQCSKSSQSFFEIVKIPDQQVKSLK